MKRLFILSFILMTVSCGEKTTEIPECYQEVDQVLWVVTDLDKTIKAYSELGFTEVLVMGNSVIESKKFKNQLTVKMAKANLGGAIVNWIELLDGSSVFHEFRDHYGDGAFSLVHRFSNRQEMKQEIQRLEDRGIQVRDDIVIRTDQESLHLVLMDTEEQGKYTLGFTYNDQGKAAAGKLMAENRHSLKINQYAFAIRDPEPVSAFWQSVGLPELQINNPVLGETKYYGELTDHQLIQGWQRHGKVSYEWCIPVKPPIVYEDHIKLHGEGIHHLAFSVENMDKVLEDYTSRGFVVSMGGTWGEEGKPGSGRYEYIDLENFGGVTMELLWNF
ncbi:MAG: VOC family protein [Bacteroidales bacterium]